MLDPFHYSAVVLDLDGVITSTRSLHVRAWKKTFDEYLDSLRSQRSLSQRGHQIDALNLRPFDPDVDYVNYVDGKPREDGIRSFLASRGITRVEGAVDGSVEGSVNRKEENSDDQHLIQDLSKKKNAYYLELLEKEGPQAFNDAIEAITVWRQQGIPLAVVTSSQNCAQVLQKAGIADWFQVRVDGIVGKQLGLRGKPEPDYFLEATRRLGVHPAQALMVEDAVAGVEAGKRGGFGAVIGLDRTGQVREILLDHGADRVISSLREIFHYDPCTRPHGSVWSIW